MDKIPREQLFAAPTMQLEPQEEQYLSSVIMPYMKQAVKVAEGDPTRHGVRSVSVDSPNEADKVLENSIRNNYIRWKQAGSPGKFVDFMQQRWAPIGAENDPTNLNTNWSPNVRGSLSGQMSPEDYSNWERLNLVRSNLVGNSGNV